MSMRRGACPGIAEPMPTGDGLLARLTPSSPVTLGNALALCQASLDFGNGIMEVSQRGSLQVRGLTSGSAPAFAQTMVRLGLGEERGPPLFSSPLLGLTTDDGLATLQKELREQFSTDPRLQSLGPKVSVVLDGRPWLLDAVSADLRLVLQPDGRLHLSIAGNAAEATSLGYVPLARAASLAALVLRQIARLGQTARARDIAVGDKLDALRHQVSASLVPGDALPRILREAIDVYQLGSDRVAVGVALPFGYAHATAMERLLMAAARHGAHSARPAPGRALLLIGVHAAEKSVFAAAAAALGFIVTPRDTRRFVVACAGAPACASAALSTRQLAPVVAEAAGALLDGSMVIHLSGCSKGCAHAGASALTLVGPDQLVVRGNARAPIGTRVSPGEFIAGLRRLAQQLREHPTAPDSEAMLVHLGAPAIEELMRVESADV